MKLGFGLYKNSLNYTNYEFVKQIGATHVVAHLTNYFGGSSPKILGEISISCSCEHPSNDETNPSKNRLFKC